MNDTIPLPRPRPDFNVHNPAGNNTPPGQGSTEVTVPRPTSDTVNVQLTTVHNWVELVFQAFGQTLPTAAKQVAILGVREASIAANAGTPRRASATDIENLAGSGTTDQVDFTQGTRTAEMSTATVWDDLLFVVYTDDDAAHTQHVDVYQASIDPGRADSAAVKLPFLLEGKLYKGYPGPHIASRYPGNNTALHIYTSSKGNIVLAREATKTMRIFKELASAETDNGKFVREEANDTIHMHFSASNLERVGGWSTGCTILKHAYGSDRYNHFKNTFNAAPNKQEIPYLVVSSQYVRSYGEWVKEVDKTPGACPGPGTTIMRDKLVSPTGITGRYLPSIMTKEFADAVLAEAERLHPAALVGPPRNAKPMNLRASIEKALFTV